jgi:hypothetical protein
LINEFEQFADNAQKNEDQDDKFDMMMFEANEALKPDDFRRQVYEEAESY